MKTKSSMVLCIAFVALAASFVLPGLAHADVNSILYIQGPGGSVWVNIPLIVPESCTVADSVGAPHSVSGHKAPCAIKAAKDAGVIADFLFTNDPSWGLFLKSINGLADGPAPDYPYWNLWKNGIFSEVGIEGISFSAGDKFQLTYGPYITNIATAAIGGAGPIVKDVYPRKLDVEQAISFLVASQQEDGSFTTPMFSDWVAIALGAYEGKSATALAAKERLENWLLKNAIPEGSVVTEYERRAMSLMALGIDPYQGTRKNYIEAILKTFDGQQFGNPDLVNDDMFALLVLERAGYEANVTPLLETLPFILSWQRDNGSFGSTDLTAVAIQVLSLYPQTEERDTALARAKQYLADYQESSGGFGNVYSTSWVLQAIAALNEEGDDWAMEADRRTPEHFLALRQALDGGLLSLQSKEDRVWATAYAVPAALEKPWGSILYAFKKPSVLLAQESSLPAPVVQNNNEVVENIKRQVIALEQEVVALQKLEHIQAELDRIALEVRAVGVRVVAFRVQQLAQNVEQPKISSLAQAPEPLQEVDLSGITLAQEDEAVPLSAEAKEAVGAQGLSPQLIILLVMIGGAIFVFSGGVNNALSLLRRTLSRV